MRISRVVLIILFIGFLGSCEKKQNSSSGSYGTGAIEPSVNQSECPASTVDNSNRNEIPPISFSPAWKQTLTNQLWNWVDERYDPLRGGRAFRGMPKKDIKGLSCPSYSAFNEREKKVFWINYVAALGSYRSSVATKLYLFDGMKRIIDCEKGLPNSGRREGVNLNRAKCAFTLIEWTNNNDNLNTQDVLKDAGINKKSFKKFYLQGFSRNVGNICNKKTREPGPLGERNRNQHDSTVSCLTVNDSDRNHTPLKNKKLPAIPISRGNNAIEM